MTNKTLSGYWVSQAGKHLRDFYGSGDNQGAMEKICDKLPNGEFFDWGLVEMIAAAMAAAYVDAQNESWTYIKHDPDGRPVAETLPEAGKHYEVSGLLQETDRTLKVWRIARYRGGGEWHDVWTDGRLKYEVYAYQSLPDPAPLPGDRG